MLKKLLRHKAQIAIVAFVVLLLALIRAYEDTLFYDPFLDYFKSDFSSMPIPEMNSGSLFANLLFRYFLNTMLSLVVIYVIFKNLDLTKFAGILYVIFFIFLIVGFFSVLFLASDSKMLLFYIRRFLIQPLFLLLFVPAFYFQERVSGKNNIS